MVGLAMPEAEERHGGFSAELGAAAEHLEVKAPSAGLAHRVSGLRDVGDFAGVARELGSALVLALNSDPVSDVPTSPESKEEVAALEGCMQVLLIALKHCGMPDDLLMSIASKIGSGTSRASLRLRFITLMYNRVSEDKSNVRFEILLTTISFSASANLVPKIVDTILPSVERFMKLWGLAVDGRRKLFKACYEALVSADMRDRAFSFNLKRLELYNNCADAELASAEDAAVEAIVDAVRLPKLYRFDTLLELSVVKRMRASSEKDKSLLYELVNIFVKEDLDVYLTFSKANQELLGKYKIDEAVSVDKMRLLTFASLGIDSQDISYETISSALHVEPDEVEEWVIRAISSGLVDAKINQLKSSVSVYRSTQRMFTREEWQPLSERINIWKVNVAELLGSVKETRESASNAATDAFAG